MCKSAVLLLLAPSLLVPATSAFSSGFEEGGEVKLVVQITVDGLRADLLESYGRHFGEDGFRRLLDNGVIFTQAHYQHANTETIVGHATLATGAHPARYGLVGNVWHDRVTGEIAYNIEDPDHPPLPSREEQASGDKVDPSQRFSRTEGRSPRARLVPTLADTLAVFTAGEANLFGISAKDRSAVAMAGQASKAFWMSADNGDFVTSQYYYDAYPDWVADWNGKRKAESYAGKGWELLHDAEDYLLAGQDDQPYETDLKGYGSPSPTGSAKLKIPCSRRNWWSARWATN